LKDYAVRCERSSSIGSCS